MSSPGTDFLVSVLIDVMAVCPKYLIWSIWSTIEFVYCKPVLFTLLIAVVNVLFKFVFPAYTILFTIVWNWLPVPSLIVFKSFVTVASIESL